MKSTLLSNSEISVYVAFCKLHFLHGKVITEINLAKGKRWGNFTLTTPLGRNKIVVGIRDFHPGGPFANPKHGVSICVNI
ncbi:MAG: hypothetical protein V3U24_06785 [Candidatus Neomarinimicrobiota bacterium]